MDSVGIYPEIILGLTLAGLIAGEIGYFGEKYRLASAIALIGLAGSIIQVFITFRPGTTLLFENTISMDGISLFFRLFFLTLASMVIVMVACGKEIPNKRRTEYYVFTIAASLSMCFAASAIDIVLMFVSISSMNILVFFMAGYAKRDVKSVESAVKYLFCSVLGTALFVYALGLLFAHTHSLNIFEIKESLRLNPIPQNSALLIVSLLFFSLAFLIGVFPFHLWVPDVLEGAPLVTALFTAIGVPAVGFAIALRFFPLLFGDSNDLLQTDLVQLEWKSLVAVASALTMLIGVFLAYRQTRATRVVGCLVVAQTGFLLMGLLVLNKESISALLFNLIVSLFSLSGIFFSFTYILGESHSDKLQDLRGMLGRAFPEVACLIFFSASFVGLPPFPGFIGRFLLIGSTASAEWYIIAIIALFATVLGVAAFVRVTGSMVGGFKELDWNRSVTRSKMQMVMSRGILLFLTLPIFALTIFADSILSWVTGTLQFILW